MFKLILFIFLLFKLLLILFLFLFISNKFTIELLKISRLNIKTFLFSKLFEKIIEKILFPIPLGPKIDIIFPSFVSWLKKSFIGIVFLLNTEFSFIFLFSFKIIFFISVTDIFSIFLYIFL